MSNKNFIDKMVLKGAKPLYTTIACVMILNPLLNPTISAKAAQKELNADESIEEQIGKDIKDNTNKEGEVVKDEKEESKGNKEDEKKDEATNKKDEDENKENEKENISKDKEDKKDKEEIDEEKKEELIRDIEYELNRNFSKYEGVRFYYDVENIYNGYLDLSVRTDVYKDDNYWTSINTDSLYKWIERTTVRTIMSKGDYDIYLDLYDRSNSRIDNFRFYSKDYIKDSYKLEEDLNSRYSNYRGLEFDFRVNDKNETAEVLMLGKNFKGSDDEWHDISTREFSRWVEDNIAYDVQRHLRKDVDIIVEDNRGRIVFSDSFSMDYFDRYEEELFRATERDLLRNDRLYKVFFEYNIFKDYNNDIVVEATADVVESDREWQELYQEEIDAFIQDIVDIVQYDFKNNNIYIKLLDKDGYMLESKYVDISKEEEVDKNKNEKIKTIKLHNLNKTSHGYDITINNIKHVANLSKDNTLLIDIGEESSNVRINLNKDVLGYLNSKKINLGVGTKDIFSEIQYKNLISLNKDDEVIMEIKNEKDTLLSSIHKPLSNMFKINNTIHLKNNTNKDKVIKLVSVIDEKKIKNENPGLYLIDKQNISKITDEIKDNKYMEIINPENGVYSLLTHKSPFSDISSSMYADEILTLHTMGIINGVTETEYEPHTPLTREQFASLLVKGFNLDNGEYIINPSFSDVSPSSWSYRYIETINKKGLMVGVGEGKFNPKEYVSKEEVITVMIRLTEVALNKPESLNRNINITNVSNWAIGNVQDAKAIGLLDKQTYFNGKEAANRDETAHYIYRTLEINNKL